MVRKTPNVGILDYGSGNLRSVEKAFMHLDINASIISTPDSLSDIDALVFPGQGTFDQCMDALNKTGLSTAIKEWISLEKPFLGVCLGLQALFEKSEEGTGKGLGVFPGYVKKFTLQRNFKIPHMGWNSVDWGELEQMPICKGILNSDQFYFVHSYHVVLGDQSLNSISTCYGYPFVSGILNKNCFATQFHPEKSQSKGLQIYRNFIEKVVADISP